MHASTFARKRARIERRAGDRPALLRKAMAHLLHDAGAAEIIIRGQLVGWRMQDGTVVCVKRRYRDWLQAQLELQNIAKHSRHAHVPVRVYHCPWCGGFHLTSREH